MYFNIEDTKISILLFLQGNNHEYFQFLQGNNCAKMSFLQGNNHIFLTRLRKI